MITIIAILYVLSVIGIMWCISISAKEAQKYKERCEK